MRTAPVPSFALALALASAAWPSFARAACDDPPRPDAPPAPKTDPAPHRESLEQFLKRLRELRDGRLQTLSSGVEALLHNMEADAMARKLEALSEDRARLVALGAEAAPLLIDHIDPGMGGTDAAKLRSIYIAQALRELSTRAVTQRLIELSQAGSIEGRVNAVHVMAASPEPERVVPVLTGIFKGNKGELRDAALDALARLGGAEAEHTLSEALADPAPEVVKVTLGALGGAHNVALAPRILHLAEITRDAVQYADALVGYYRQCPEAADKNHVLALIRIAADIAPLPEVRVRVLEVLPTLAEKVDGEARKELRAIVDSPTKEVHEAALVTLVQLGDRSARKELLTDYDLVVERNKNYASGFESRAKVLYRIGDWREAIRDWQTALKLSANDFRAHPEDAYIGLARCFMQQNKLKEAAQQLEKAPISLKQLQELSKEPIFAKLVENAKYRVLFKLE